MPDGTRIPCAVCEPEKRAEFLRAREQGEKQKRLQARIEAMLAPCFRDARFDNFERLSPRAEKIYQFCRDYAESWPEQQRRGTSLLFFGPCGTGKGHLAAAIAHEIMERYQATVIFDQFIEVVSRIKDGWRGQGETERQTLEKLWKADLLVLDEIGVQFDTNAERVLLYRIVNHRYEHYRPTIMTTNCRKKDLPQFADERIVDRLFDLNRGSSVIEFNLESYRRGSRANR